MISMSSLSTQPIHSFLAPISIGPTHSSTIGSWETMRTPVLKEVLITSNNIFRMTLHQWKQQYREHIFDVCLSWVSDDLKKQYIELHGCEYINIDSIAPYIETILETNHQEMLSIYQHIHPGAVRSFSVAMRVGNEGASQSD